VTRFLDYYYYYGIGGVNESCGGLATLWNLDHKIIKTSLETTIRLHTETSANKNS